MLYKNKKKRKDDELSVTFLQTIIREPYEHKQRDQTSCFRY